MRIVVASGKGGTGKTTVSTSLALAASRTHTTHFLDCDVEAPNAALFLKPELDSNKTVGIPIPKIDPDLCNLCGRCAEVCQFNALAVVGKSVLVYPELCHGCGSCTLECPEKAITEVFNPTGMLERGPAGGNINFAHGRINIGEPMAVPIIRQLKTWMNTNGSTIAILDSPPGASCPVVETMRGADYILLVTEPTPFGLHDLKQVVEIVQQMDVPSGVIINRDGIGDSKVEEYCQEQNIPVLMKIPMERRIAEGLAQGHTLIEIAPEFIPAFEQTLQQIIKGVQA